MFWKDNLISGRLVGGMVIIFGAFEVSMNYKTGKITVMQKDSTSEAQQVTDLINTIHKK